MAFSFNRANRLRVRRLFRRRQRQVESATEAAGAQLETNLIGRFDRLFQVKRFVIGWLLLVILIVIATIVQTMGLSSYYQHLQPVAGGIYNEGMVGTYSNANPIYATGSVDTAVSKLVFSGLLKYDNNNGLIGDLASGYSVDTNGKQYTVSLRNNLTWQDGQPLTADDVAFTFHTIQNADANSPLQASWQGIRINVINKLTVQFNLPSTLSSFPYSLTTGIIPEHILANIPASQLRASDFNTLHPVGAGPFSWQTIQTSGGADPAKTVTSLGLRPFTHYAGGAPKLDSFVIRTYPTEDRMVAAFKSRDLTAMAGLNSVPANLKSTDDAHIYNFPSTAELMTFFKTTSGVLSDPQLRQALVKGANVEGLIKGLSYQPRPVNEPLLLGQLGYDAKYKQASYNPAAANAQLDSDGWLRGNDGTRSKAGQKLTFKLYAQNTPENSYILDYLTADWKKIGVEVIAVPQEPSDFQTTLEFHTYDALLYGISIGADPDVFAYWDSTQADIRSASRLNFSEYSSTVADNALEAGRTRTDPTLRAIKYRPFLQAWQSDAPALGLYQPRFLYITRGTVYGLSEHPLNADSDRYSSVNEWQIHTSRVTNK